LPMFSMLTNALFTASVAAPKPGTALRAAGSCTGVKTTGTAISGALKVVPPGCPIKVAVVVIASGGIGRPEPGGGAGGVS